MILTPDISDPIFLRIAHLFKESLLHADGSFIMVQLSGKIMLSNHNLVVVQMILKKRFPAQHQKNVRNCRIQAS